MNQTKTYKKTRVKNVYKTNFGKFRARKMINGKTISKNFKLMREAKAYLESINN